jgi:hypothetical protein
MILKKNREDAILWKAKFLQEEAKNRARIIRANTA